MELGGNPSKTMLPLVLLQRPLFTAQSPGLHILSYVEITMGLTAATVFSDKLSGCQCICISTSIYIYTIYTCFENQHTSISTQWKASKYIIWSHVTPGFRKYSILSVFVFLSLIKEKQ
jgi:hypothetical protein